MAFSPSDLYQEVLKIIAERAAAGTLTNRAWLVTAVLSNHPLKRPHKKDPDDFSVCCRQLAVSAAVDRALARLKVQDEGGSDPDLDELPLPRLPGFKHLRRVYPVKRGGFVMLVPIDQMTDDELVAKSNTYDAASVGFAEHADEMRRYRATRSFAAE